MNVETTEKYKKLCRRTKNWIGNDFSWQKNDFSDFFAFSNQKWLEVVIKFGSGQCDQKKLPNVYKNCLKMIDFNTFTKIA